MKRYPVIIALDGMPAARALQIAKETKGWIWGYKVHELLLRDGFGIIKKLKKYGKVFVDLKFHDIPSTVEKEVMDVVALGADLVSVHASGGEKMLRAAVRAGGNKIAAVTTLSSLSTKNITSIYRRAPTRVVFQLTQAALRANVKNVICSPHEIKTVRLIFRKAYILTPGIREKNDRKDDQKRTMGAHQALAAGANLLVVGRPITRAKNPRQALENLFLPQKS